VKARVRPGPRPGWGRVDIDDSDGEYTVNGRRLKPTVIGRFRRPCLVFPLSLLKVEVGDEVEVERVLRCRTCGSTRSSLINGLCDDCYNAIYVGDPLLAGLP